MSKADGKIVRSRKKQVFPLKVKIQMLDLLRLESFSSVARIFNVNESTVRSIKKSEEKIRNSISSTSLSTKIVRDPVLEKMEAELTTWIEDCDKRAIPLTNVIIREKAKLLYQDCKQCEGYLQNSHFQASEGWFHKFKMRRSLHNIQIDGEAASKATLTITNPEDFIKFIADGKYKPEQIFNADETSLFWKRLPNKIHISKTLAEFNDKVTLLLCSNASGDCLIKPLMLNRSLNPKALKNKNKESLPVFWRANRKPWVTSAVFTEWFLHCFVPEVEEYLTKMNLETKAVLVLGNASGHPRLLEVNHPNIRVIFLPANTAPMLQPMNQGIIRAFKLNYIRNTFKLLSNSLEINPKTTVTECWEHFDIAKCIDCIKDSLRELKQSTLNSCWIKLWPSVVRVDKDESIGETMENIICIANSIGRSGFEHLQLSDITEFLESQEENTTEVDIEVMLNPDDFIVDESSISEIEQIKPTIKPTIKNLSKGLRLANNLCDFFIKIDPLMERSLVFKNKVVDATLEYKAELNSLRKARKPENVTSFSKPMPQPGCH